MSKTQAFKAFELIMRCLFWIMWAIAYPGNDDNKKNLNVLQHEYVEFMLKDSD